ncbi:unnamed protein product [Dovyalis caffra]|uniref:Endonuclease/exonuclease/phosphatase domain-containing protein n=1 Tax=Dovyalis caffra TaxID=77055 RepID=A0AAV1SE61_9ROSI|nr:unnamed protein product [Dovyalis caffra]
MNHRAPVSERTVTTSKNKRKHPFHNEQQYRRRKRNKSVSKTEKTLTLKPHISNQNSLPISNRFQSIQHNKKHNCRSNSSNFEFDRKWTFSSHDSSTYEDRVVFVSYNILGVENALKHPDLQEVDRFDDLDYRLRQDGFRGVYKARTGEACDGCAVFWKDKLFTLLHEEHIEFQSFGLRNNVAQFCVLKWKHHHDLAPWYAAVYIKRLRFGSLFKLMIRIFLEKAYKLSQEWGSIPVIIGGDLNSLPQSAIYQFLNSSELDLLLHDRRNISGQLEHPPKQNDFRSWDESVARGAVARETTEENPWQHPTTPSLWELHSTGLVPVRVLETLPINILRRSAGLPNENSDRAIPSYSNSTEEKS